MVHAFNPSTQEAEAGWSFGSPRPALLQRVLGQPGLHSETLSLKKKKKKLVKRYCINKMKIAMQYFKEQPVTSMGRLGGSDQSFALLE